MSLLTLILEPTIVFTILIGGVYFNRSHKPSYLPLPTPSSTHSKTSAKISRIWATYPFITEVLYWLLTYVVYQGSRAIVAKTFNENTTELAQAHGIAILDIESALGIDVEKGLQNYFIASHPGLLALLNKIYSFIHIPGTLLFFAYTYSTLPHTLFTQTRRTLALSNLIAFIIFTILPTMPPRLLPPHYGFVDTVHTTNVASVWTTNTFCNQLAAMPSLHFGYSIVVGWTLFLTPKYTPLPLRAVGFVYPMIILLAIVVTANHYILDAVVGLGVVCLAWWGNSVLCYLSVVEEWVLALVGIRKPIVDNEEIGGRRRRKDSGCGIGMVQV